MDRKKLIFNIGEESLPTITNFENYKDSPFSDAIDKGLDIMNGLYNSFCNRCNSSGLFQDVASQQHIYPNNIVAFLGDRGSGKTSCLLSTLEIFKKQVVEENRTLNEDLFILDIIDPSFFDNDHNILEFFIGEFYKQFKKSIEKYENFSTDKRNEIKKIQAEFSNVKHAIQFIDSKYSDLPYDDLDDVRRLSSGIELSQSLNELITCYLKFIGKKCLVVVIDDLDLNINASYRMIEQIRMNLVLPNVIVLMAAKLSQLKLGIVNSLDKYSKKGLIAEHEISEMATRYLDKLLPLGHRVIMPDADSFMKMELEVRDNGSLIIEPVMTQFAVLQLIFQKTRFLFYNHEDHASLIFPRNLRELRMLVTALCQMENPKDGDKSIHEYNKYTFKEYIKDQWLPTLSYKYEDFASSLIKEDTLEKINKKVISFLIMNCQSLKSWQDIDSISTGIDEESKLQRIKLREITESANYNGNISIGDVSYVVSLVKELDDTAETDRLIFFIQTFYSIKLYELYDEMTDNLDSNGVKIVEDSPSTIPLLRKDKAISLPDYFKLVGGSFFTIVGNTFLPTDKLGSSREISLIDGFTLRNEISALIRDLSDGKGKWKEPTAEQSIRINLIEFFIFCSRRRTQLRSDDYSWRNYDAWRTNIELSYLQPFTNTKNIVFDITAPFFTMVFPKIAYYRYSPKFYDLALSCKRSLLYKLLNGSDRRYDDRNKFADLMSRICLRNMEVRADLELWLKRNKTMLRPDSLDAIGVIMDFYSRFGRIDSSYSVKTYDRGVDNTSFHKIEFTPLCRLSDVLKKVAADEMLTRLFTKIYSSSNKVISNQNYQLEEILQKVLSLDAEKISKNHIEQMVQYVSDLFNKSRDTEIRSEIIVQALFEYPLLPDTLLSDLFDKTLRFYYISNYANNISSKDKELQARLKAISAEISKAKKERIIIEKERQNCMDKYRHVEDEISGLSLKKQKCIIRIGEINRLHSNIEVNLKEITAHRDKCINQLYLNDEGDDRLSSIKLTQELSALDNKIDEKNKELANSANELLDATMELSKLDSEITLRSKDSELLKHELDELTMGLESQTTLILSLNSDKDEISMNQRTTQKKLEETIKQLASYK